eukprot:6017513-Alexandrium_andersonii.AAC.1
MALQRRLLLWSDSSNVCRAFAAMTRGPSFLRFKPWGLRPNGDVWEQLQRMHMERGPSNTRVLKTKGHATQQHVAEGAASAHGMHGNSMADQVADRAARWNRSWHEPLF